jgi:hypothetical protein
MITICSLLWAPNKASKSFSTMYTPEWVEKLYRGFARNLSQPFRFVCYVDRAYHFKEPIEQRRIRSDVPSYADCVQPLELGVPSILCGLDTIITGNCDGLAAYCLTADRIALPIDPLRKPPRECNGVVLVPAGQQHIYTAWNGENDMDWMNAQPHNRIDDLFPGHVRSWRCDVSPNGLGDTRICYFHGRDKPHELAARGDPLTTRHWL